LKCDKGKLKREIEASHCAMDICSWNTGTANIVRETYIVAIMAASMITVPCQQVAQTSTVVERVHTY